MDEFPLAPNQTHFVLDPNSIRHIPIAPEPSRYVQFRANQHRFTASIAALGVMILTACGPTQSSTPKELTAASSAEADPTSSSQATESSTSPSSISPEKAQFPEHSVMATIFYLGEVPSADNAYISNTETAWDSSPTKRFGGTDDPSRRDKNGLPVGFDIKHNPFYIALPADEFDKSGLIAGAREASPWQKEHVRKTDSLFKGRWVQIKRGDKTVFAQWLDCGPSDDPNGARDYAYVFGPSTSKPKNTFGLKAGIDLSPAAAFNLGFGVAEGGAEVTWKFVDDSQVPDGLWKQFTPIDHHTHH